MQENNQVPIATSQVTAVPTKSNNFITILLLILLVVSVTISGFFAYQTQKLVKELGSVKSQVEGIANGPAVSTTNPISAQDVNGVDPNSNWKTYTNKALGFELKYPSTFTIDKEMNDQYNRVTMFKSENSTFEVMLRAAGEGLDKYYYMDNPYFRKSILGGKNANVYVYDASKNACINDGPGPSCPVSFVVYVAQNGSDLYHLGFFGDNNLSDLEKQVLSTFKFLN